MKSIQYVLLFLIVTSLCACSLRPVIKPVPEKPGDSLFERAEEQFQAGNFDAALTVYGQYLSEYPDQHLAPAALLKTGTIYMATGDYPRARESFQEMIQKYPESSYAPDGMVEILVTYYHEGRYEEVVRQSYDIPEDLSPSDYLIRKYAIVGDAYMAMGATEDAVGAFATAFLKTDPAEAKGVVAKLMKALSLLPSDVLDTLEGQTENPTLKGVVAYQRCQNYFRDGRNDDGLRSLEGFIREYPDHFMVEEARRLKEAYAASGFNSNLIGCLLPISGKYEAYGMKAQMGFDLAYNRFSMQYGDFPMRVIYRDTESDPERTRSAVKELAELGVAAIIGPVGTVEEAVDEAQLRGVPIIALTGKEAITESGDYVFRNFITRNMQVKSVVSYSFEVLGLNNFAILYPDEDYGKDMMNLFWDEVRYYGGEIVGVESYSSGSTDFAGPIKRMINDYYTLSDVPSVLSDEDQAVLDATGEALEESVPEEPVVDFDAVFIPDSSEKVSLILPQLSFYDVGNVYLIGTNLWHTDTLVELANISALGSVIPDGFFAGSDTPEVVAFIEDFRQAFDETPGFIEAVTYDSAMIVLETLGQGGITSKSELKDRLLDLSDYPGVTGRTSFDATGDAVKDLYLLEIDRSGFVELKR